ncbi:MAG: hypothetical protein ACMUIP_01060 [bacterium]
MKKIKLNRRQTDSALFIGAITITLIYIFIFQLPFSRKLKKLLSDKKIFLENTVSSNSINQRSIQLTQFSKIQGTLNDQIQSLEHDFSHSGLFLWEIIQNIGILAKNLGLKIILTQPKIEQQSDKFQNNSIEITLDGKFLTIYRFIFLLEKYTPAIKFNSLAIETDSQGKSCNGDLHISFLTPSASQSSNLEDHVMRERGLKISSFKLADISWDEKWPDHLDRDIFQFKTKKRFFFQPKVTPKPLRLEATFTGGQPMAVINNQPVSIGESIEGYQLTEIKDSLVILTRDGKDTTLLLNE